MPVKERDTPMLVGVSARVSQTRGARVDGDEIKERKREREEKDGKRYRKIRASTAERKRQKAHSLIHRGRGGKQRKEGLKGGVEEMG